MGRRLTVLLSAMGLKDRSILETLNITGDVIVINQTEQDSDETFREEDRIVRFISSTERGLSVSRNTALEAAREAEAELCVFCDNDCVYVKDYEKIITGAFDRHPESDILVFFIRRPERSEPVFRRERRMGRLSSMKIFSPEIAFRLKAVRDAGLSMDPLFGAGARFLMGEENIFLFDALRAGLKLTYIPVKIAELMKTESTWFQGYNEAFFKSRGAGYTRMSPRFNELLMLQFAIRKRSLYGGSGITVSDALRWMKEGKKEYEALYRR
ncbi:MAG: glycosyltransferase [Lachnospiraceae bacterium]|nr:glycosyltransferase [Lachnospiraceae bacterium]